MFEKVLVANRGEIAIRLLRTLREMNIRSVAVFSDADREAAHPTFADEAYALGGSDVRESYLSVDKLVAVAEQSGAQAVLPGYGFLSENTDFARRCAELGVVFVGPSPEAIEQMGQKEAARELMRKAGVPVVPGGPAHGIEEAIATAERVGYPVLIKARAGGGGRGMRVAQDTASLRTAFATARSEAERAFGDGEVYIEKLLTGARHVEVQVLGDKHGGLVHLFERDCSVQRRHQKLVEETPCPAIPKETLSQLTAAALLGASAVSYYSAGTLEFLLDQSGQFYFIEMNTRLQVEHTISELVTGIDLVRQMLRVAAGEPLGFGQADIQRRGHAIECRVCAEDPRKNFTPSSGLISELAEPSGPFVRVDSGVCRGQRVSTYYDSLLAKVCVWAETRELAVARMRRAISEFALSGPVTNLEFHARLLEHPSFTEGRYDTGFVDRHPDLLKARHALPHEVAAFVVASELDQPAAAAPQVVPVSRWASSFRP